MFIISLTYKQPLDIVEKHLAEHVAFLDKHYALNNFIFSGRKNPRTGGIILANNVSKEEISSIIKEDPFNIHGIAEYEMVEVIPTKYDTRFEVFVKDVL